MKSFKQDVGSMSEYKKEEKYNFFLNFNCVLWGLKCFCQAKINANFTLDRHTKLFSYTGEKKVDRNAAVFWHKHTEFKFDFINHKYHFEIRLTELCSKFFFVSYDLSLQKDTN